MNSPTVRDATIIFLEKLLPSLDAESEYHLALLRGDAPLRKWVPYEGYVPDE